MIHISQKVKILTNLIQTDDGEITSISAREDTNNVFIEYRDRLGRKGCVSYYLDSLSENSSEVDHD